MNVSFTGDSAEYQMKCLWASSSTSKKSKKPIRSTANEYIETPDIVQEHYATLTYRRIARLTHRRSADDPEEIDSRTHMSGESHLRNW